MKSTMKRGGAVVGTLALGVAVLAIAGYPGQDVRGERIDLQMARYNGSAPSSSLVELRHRTRWTCSVRHAKTGYYYKCTDRDERKSCRCAIRQCKYWNTGHESQCSTTCKCSKK